MGRASMLQRAFDPELAAQVGSDDFVDRAIVVVGRDLHGDRLLGAAAQLTAQGTAAGAIRQESGVAVRASHRRALTTGSP